MDCKTLQHALIFRENWNYYNSQFYVPVLQQDTEDILEHTSHAIKEIAAVIIRLVCHP